MIYEDIKTQRMYHKRPERREEMIPYDIQIVDNNGVIEKVFVNMEKEAISIEKQVIPAFTLIECLIGLMILSSLLLTFNLLIQQTIQVSEFCSVKIKRVANIFSTIRRRTQEQSQCLCEKSATALHDRG